MGLTPHARPVISKHVLKLIHNFAVVTVAEVFEEFRVDVDAQEPDGAVAQRELRPAVVIAAEAPHGIGRLRVIVLRLVPTVPVPGWIFKRAGVPQGFASAGDPAQRNLAVEFFPDENRARAAVADLLEPHAAVQEEHAVLVHIDRGLLIIVAADVAGLRDAHPGGRSRTAAVRRGRALVNPNAGLADVGVLRGIHAFLQIVMLEQRLLIDERQDGDRPTEVVALLVPADRMLRVDRARRQRFVLLLVVENRQADLGQIVFARGTAGGFAGLLNRRQ